jgi:hypothetical protein
MLDRMAIFPHDLLPQNTRFTHSSNAKPAEWISFYYGSGDVFFKFTSKNITKDPHKSALMKLLRELS